ncbi:MAG: hypothetical protein ABIB11_06180 [Candidatus Omnitrophota bacterium]
MNGNDQQKLNALYAQQRADRQELAETKRTLEEMRAIIQQANDAPKWIENIPGKRVPYMAGITINIAASSTTRVEGTFTISRDGPFVCCAIHMVWKRTTGAYQNWWGPATTYDLRIAPASQQLGFSALFDQVIVHSFDVEIADRGSDRNWQNVAFASTLFSPQAGGVYVLPIAYLFDTNSVAEVALTPTAAQTVAGTVLVELLGYKIVQGATFQP